MKSIRRYLMITISAVLVTAFVTAMVVSYFEARHEVDELFDAELAQTTRLLKASFEKVGGQDVKPADLMLSSSATPDLIPDVDSNQERTLYGHRYERKVMFQVRQGETVLFESENSSLELVAAPELGFSEVIVDDQLWYLFTLKEGGLSYTAGERADIRDELAEEILTSYLMPLMICLPFVLVLSLWILKRGLQPLRELESSIIARGESNLTHIQMKDTPEEIQPVVQALNHLFDQVNRSMELERRFTAMASHEMRTPVSVLKVNAQNALKAASAEEQQHYLLELNRGIDRASRLMEQLLTLSKLEQAELSYEWQVLDLLPMVREEIAALYPLALERGIQIEMVCTMPKAMQYSVPQLLPIVMRNLIENAIKYTPDNGEVRVGIQMAGDMLLLSIEDSGPGVPAEQHELIFTRFYRLPNAEVQGSGLGLAIVKRILDILEVRVALSSSEHLGGLKVELAFPTTI